MHPLRLFLQLGSSYDLPRIMELAKRAEESGFYGVALAEHVGASSEDVMVAMGALSQVCKKIKLLTNLINHHPRHPVVLAMAASTLSAASNGRFILGLGTGAADSLQSLNVDDEHPIRKMGEVMEIIRRLLAGEEVSYRGDFFKISSAKLVQGKGLHVPISVAGIQNAMLRFVSKRADGILLSNGSTVEYVEHCVKIIKEFSPPHFETACSISYIPTSNREEGLKIAREIVLRYLVIPGIGETILENSGFDPNIAKDARKQVYSGLKPELLESMVALGKEEKLIERIHIMRKSGITIPIILTQPPYIERLLSLPSSLA